MMGWHHGNDDLIIGLWKVPSCVGLVLPWVGGGRVVAAFDLLSRPGSDPFHVAGLLARTCKDLTGSSTVLFSVDADNHRLARFYRSLGGECIRRRKRSRSVTWRLDAQVATVSTGDSRCG